jgi:hypothetical protein
MKLAAILANAPKLKTNANVLSTGPLLATTHNRRALRYTKSANGGRERMENSLEEYENADHSARALAPATMRYTAALST